MEKLFENFLPAPRPGKFEDERMNKFDNQSITKLKSEVLKFW
jgi:hypothetical protein